jgi:hypothetical protein
METLKCIRGERYGFRSHMPKSSGGRALVKAASGVETRDLSMPLQGQLAESVGVQAHDARRKAEFEKTLIGYLDGMQRGSHPPVERHSVRFPPRH